MTRSSKDLYATWEKLNQELTEKQTELTAAMIAGKNTAALEEAITKLAGTTEATKIAAIIAEKQEKEAAEKERLAAKERAALRIDELRKQNGQEFNTFLDAWNEAHKKLQALRATAKTADALAKEHGIKAAPLLTDDLETMTRYFYEAVSYTYNKLHYQYTYRGEPIPQDIQRLGQILNEAR